MRSSVDALTSAEWITGGPSGSKDATLVFRTCALNQHNDADGPSSRAASSTTSLDVSAGATSDEYNETKENVSAAGNRRQTPKLNINKFNKFSSTNKGLKKRTHDSLSSSENSISSVCDDPTEIEYDISTASAKMGKEQAATTATNDIAPEEIEEDDGAAAGAAATTTILDVSKMPASKLKITYKFLNTEKLLLRRILTSHGLREADENETYNLLWSGVHIKADMLRNLSPYQRVNHFPR